MFPHDFDSRRDEFVRSHRRRHSANPSEKSLAGHLLWLRELLDIGLLSVLQWADTRDMSADGHTKGSIDRKAILDLMKGIFRFQHATKEFTPPHRQISNNRVSVD